MHDKLIGLQDLPHSKDDEKFGSARDSVTSSYPCSALHALYNPQIGSTNIFSATKSCDSGRTTDTPLQRSALSPRGGRDDLLQVF